MTRPKTHNFKAVLEVKAGVAEGLESNRHGYLQV